MTEEETTNQFPDQSLTRLGLLWAGGALPPYIVESRDRSEAGI